MDVQPSEEKPGVLNPNAPVFVPNALPTVPSHIYPLAHTQITSLQHAPQPMPNTQYGINTNYDHLHTFEVNMTTFDNTPPVPNTIFDSNFHDLGSHYKESQVLEPHSFPNRDNPPKLGKFANEESELFETQPFPTRNNKSRQENFRHYNFNPWGRTFSERNVSNSPDSRSKGDKGNRDSWRDRNHYDSTHQNRECQPDNTKKLGHSEHNPNYHLERSTEETRSALPTKLEIEPNILIKIGHPQAPHPFSSRNYDHREHHSDRDQRDFKEISYEKKEDQKNVKVTTEESAIDQKPPHPFEPQNRNYNRSKHKNSRKPQTDHYKSSENENFRRKDTNSAWVDDSTLPDKQRREMVKVSHPSISNRHSKDEKRFRDHYSSHRKHKDTTQQEDVKKEQLDEAAEWGEAVENRSNDRRSSREDRPQTSDQTRRKEFYDRSRRPPRTNRSDRSYETRPKDEDFRSRYENRSRDFGRKQSTRTRHEDATHWSDGEQSNTLPMLENEKSFQRGQPKSASFHQKSFERQRHPERFARDRRDRFDRDDRINHRSTQKKFHSKTLVETSSTVLNEGLKDDSSCNEESRKSGSDQPPKPHSSKINNKRRKNSPSLSKQNHEDTSTELEVSVMDKLINEELSKKATLMSLMARQFLSPSGSLKKGINDKRKDSSDNQTSETKEVTSETDLKKKVSGTKDKRKKKVHQEEADTEPEPRVDLTESSEKATVWTGGVIKKYQIEEGLKFIDPRMEREKLSSSANDVVAQMGDSIGLGINRYSEGSFQAMKAYPWDRSKGMDEMEIEYDRWDKDWRNIKEFKVVNEVEGDLFEQPDDFSLAHCVAEDLRMGSGIAVAFKREFKNIPDLLDQRVKQGGIATIHDEANNRYIYYLVTKRESSGKPTYYTMWKSLYRMREHVKANEVKKIATPRLGCGLDRLEWDRVKSMMEYLFRDFDVEIKVCNFQQIVKIEDKKSKCKLVIQDYPITKIPEGTLIIYFTTLWSPPDNIMLQISKKSNFLPSFHRHRPKSLGEIVYFDDLVNNLGVLGCVVRHTSSDVFSFKILHKCLQDVNKKNRSFGNDTFNYVAFQWVDEMEYDDYLINQKIITLFINTLRNVEVYVCRGRFDDELPNS